MLSRSRRRCRSRGNHLQHHRCRDRAREVPDARAHHHAGHAVRRRSHLHRREPQRAVRRPGAGDADASATVEPTATPTLAPLPPGSPASSRTGARATALRCSSLPATRSRASLRKSATFDRHPRTGCGACTSGAAMCRAPSCCLAKTGADLSRGQRVLDVQWSPAGSRPRVRRDRGTTDPATHLYVVEDPSAA